ncbi:MAG TPA: DUF1697 domain-containing protein [Vicinamibacterales bacterium]|nr:DUF1697 domain-containing protein [Vicinamibacterales bacterium]
MSEPGQLLMKTYVALIRGINVGGNRRLPMAVLTDLLEDLGCVDVRTYIQSGNVVFRSATSDRSSLARQLTVVVSKTHGFEPHVLLLTPKELEHAAADNPYSEAAKNPQALHLFFLDEPPKTPDTAAMEKLKTKTERYQLEGKIFYFYTPDGFGRSKLGAAAERLLGVPATARNWRTVTTLVEMTRTT